MTEINWYQKVMLSFKRSLENKIRSIFVLEEKEKQELIDLVNLVEDVDYLYQIDEKINDILKKTCILACNLIDKFDEKKLEEFKENIIKDLVNLSQTQQKDLIDQIWIDLEKHINI